MKPTLLTLLSLSLSTLILPLFTTANPSPNPPSTGYSGPESYRHIRIRLDADIYYTGKRSSRQTVFRVPWDPVLRFTSPYDEDDTDANEYYYDDERGLGFGRMSILTADYRFRGRLLVRSAQMPLTEATSGSFNAVYETSLVTCVFYVDRLGSEKFFSNSNVRTDREGREGTGGGPSDGIADQVRDWRPVSEPFTLDQDVSVATNVDGLKCWNWFEGKEWSKQIDGSLDIWNTFVEEQIYGPEGRDPYYRIWGDQPGLRSYFT